MYVISTLLKTFIFIFKTVLEGFWIGLTDILVEGEWVWMSTQTTAHYTNWWPGEPNNDQAEDCGSLFSDYSFKWNDAKCLLKYNFICEKE